MKSKTMNRLKYMALLAVLLAAVAPVCASENDEGIEPAFKKTYVYTTYLKGDDIRIEAKDGVVTLTGTVAEESHKTLAQETVANLPGVTRVDNKLATNAEVASENADTWMGRKIKIALFFHRNVNAGATTVEVADGIVTLTGEASSPAQKELTTEYAKDIEGVKEVKNEMTIAMTPEPLERTQGEKLDDASVTAQVKTALWAHRSTSSLTTKVVTRDGKVTLTGIALNDAEKSLVTKLVSDIRGVTDVDNQMTIEVPNTK